jgi:O-acetyl-ADP-ribose deacetylase (regulator of RNase III)
LPAPEVEKKKGKKPKAKSEAKLPGEEGLFDGALLPALGTTHQGVKCPVTGSCLALFKGKIKRVKVDLMVIEGDQDPQIRGAERKRLARIAGPALQEASLARGGRSAGNLRVTPGYQLPCQLLAQAVHTMGTDLESLKLCYLTALNYARKKGLRTVSFSLLGTVLNLKCPPDTAARVALEQILTWLQGKALGSLEKIILCAHGPVNQKLYLMLGIDLITLICPQFIFYLNNYQIYKASLFLIFFKPLSLISKFGKDSQEQSKHLCF